MKRSLFFKLLFMRSLVLALCVGMGLPLYTVTPAMAQTGTVTRTPNVPMELPVEVEIELAPAASLKKAPLWKELIQLLKNPYAAPVRRPSFTATPLAPLDVWGIDYNFLTSQPLRLRTSDGEISWDQPGPLFDNAEVVPVTQYNVPTAVRTPIGHLVACPNTPAYQAVTVPAGFCTGKPAGSLVVLNTSGSGLIPPDGTVVAVAAVVGGVLQELAGVSTTLTDNIVGPLEIPINEEDFFRPATDVGGVANRLRPYIGRPAAEVLGKALFWDMQVGSDGVQACGSCHFHAGADNRTKGQLNPNITNPNPSGLTLEVQPPNTDVVASDFPFHKTVDPNAPGEPGNVLSDANDTMSSMGVSRFKQFVDIPPIGTANNGSQSLLPGGTAVQGVRALKPDIGTLVLDPVAVNQGLRRVEPRNTPTMHAAAFNLDNFWDGRARFNYNGGSVFGPSDPQAHIFIDPGNPNGAAAVNLQGAINGHIRPDLIAAGDPTADQPVRIKFSSLASQSNGPPLSEFEMSFAGRNWAKIGKKMLQNGVTPLANQLVDPTDSVLGPFSNQRNQIGGPVNRPGRPGLNVSYEDLIEAAFKREFWHNTNRHLNGAACATDPFDGYCLTIANGAATRTDTNEFRQREANFSMFFGLSVQAYEELLIPDDSPFDRFMDANPLAANGIGQPGEQAVLFPTLIPSLVSGQVPLVSRNGAAGDLTLVPGFGPDELFGFDIFAGGNLTAALPAGTARNPITANGFAVGSNPFTRNARCMLCHLGPEQTDHSINISHGLLKGDAEFEFPTPPSTGISYTGPGGNTDGVDIPAPTIIIPSPEPPGPFAVVPGLILAEEIAGPAQDAVEVEPRGFALHDNILTPWDDRIVAQPGFFAFGDQGIYNVGLRPNVEDMGRGGSDPFGFPLSLSALALINIAQPGFVPCDGTVVDCTMTNIDPLNLEASFELTGEGLPFPGTLLTLQSINPGFEKTPINPSLPAYLAPWVNELPAGELHPQIDELGFAPNTITPPIGGPALEFAEAIFGADVHCGLFDPALFGNGPPNFGWGPATSTERVCPNNQSGTTGNFDVVLHGTWPVPNRVLKNGAFKAPPLRNVELTGPYFHTGSYLTLRQVVDFYLRGGDFPDTNQESRDPHILDVSEQAFGFGRVAGANLGIIDLNDLVPGAFVPGTAGCPEFPPGTVVPCLANIADALPDTVYRYDAMPDTNHPLTPEPATSTPEDAAVSLVKFLLTLTDDRVKFERAPFDKPEMFIPIDGRAPENVAGRGAVGVPNTLIGESGVPCTVNAVYLANNGPDGPNPGPVCFRQIPATGAAGMATPLPNFLGVTNIPPGQPGFNCSASAGPVSHFCSTVIP